MYSPCGTPETRPGEKQSLQGPQLRVQVKRIIVNNPSTPFHSSLIRRSKPRRDARGVEIRTSPWIRSGKHQDNSWTIAKNGPGAAILTAALGGLAHPPMLLASRQKRQRIIRQSVHMQGPGRKEKRVTPCLSTNFGQLLEVEEFAWTIVRTM